MIVIALDLSTKNTGIVVGPLDWGGDWSKLSVLEHGIGMPTTRLRETDRVKAIWEFSKTVISRAVLSSGGLPIGHVFFESYAFRARNLVGAGELGMAARLAALQFCPGAELLVANQTAARKLLLGKVRRGKEKVDVANALIAAGFPRQSDFDCYDAMCVFNWAMHELGGYCFVGSES